jgi:hypothetical protein
MAIEEIILALLNVTSIRSKRPVKLAAMFMDLVDRTEWPAYYDVRIIHMWSIQKVFMSQNRSYLNLGV